MKSSTKISLPSFMQIHLYCNGSYKQSDLEHVVLVAPM